MLGALGTSPSHADAGLVEWRDWAIGPTNREHPVTRDLHVAATTIAPVHECHAAAVAAGYTDHGAPGELAVYHPGYHAAFVLDPDGHNVEVVHHASR